MYDQLTIGDKASYTDFSASLASRKIAPPKKKSIKATVPFSNVTYDFSAINGETYWEERELEYIFEITADDPEELEELKRAFSSWVMNVLDEEIHDPFIPFHHFRGTYSDMDYEDDEGLDKTTATVRFTAYPYMIADTPTVREVVVPASGEETVLFPNESSHPVAPTIYSDLGIRFVIGNTSYSVSAGTLKDEAIRLPVGLTSITLDNLETSPCTVRISLREEVF